MYKKVYRQEGGLAEEGFRAQIREASRKAIEDWNKRTKGEVAAKVRTPKPIRKLPTNPEERLIPQVIDKLNPEAWLYRGTTEPISDARKYIQNLPFKEALELDKTSYAYDPKLSPKPPTTKLGELVDEAKYIGKGLTSLTGKDVGPIGGGTPGTRKIYETIMGIPGLEKTLKTVGRLAGPVGTGLSIADAIARYKAGDYSGAVLSTLSAIPGFGIPATVAQLGTDYLGITGADKDEGGLASLPEAQADEPWYTEDWDTFVSKRREDPDTDLQYIGPEVATINVPTGTQFSEPDDQGYYTALHSPYSDLRAINIPGKGLQFIDKDYNERFPTTPTGQPTGFEGTGYGGLTEAQKLANPYIGASHNSPMWFGGFPLQAGDTLTAQQIKSSRQGFSDPYRIPQNLKIQYNDDGTGTIIKRPIDEMSSSPGYTTDNWFEALRYYNPNYEEDRANYFSSRPSNQYIIPTGQPTGFAGTGYGQFSPQPTGLMPIGMPVVPGGPAI